MDDLINEMCYLLRGMESSEPVVTRKRSLGCLSITALTAAAALIVIGIVAVRVLNSSTGIIKSGFQLIGDLPTKFQNQHITETFRESLTQIDSSNGDILELATLESEETITKFDMRTLFNDVIYLGTSVAEIKVPAVYRYHLRLSDDWRLETKGNVVTVIAPIIRPSLPPAIRTEKMEKKSESGWLRFNREENLAELEKSLTPTLEKRAASPGKIKQVRDASRRSVAEFVRNWLLREDQWRESRLGAIVVVFADEPEASDSTKREVLPAVSTFAPEAKLQ